MPFKHQTQSYRTKNGTRFTCWQDCCENDTSAQAKAVVAELRAQGRNAFAEKQDGFHRVFVEAA